MKIGALAVSIAKKEGHKSQSRIGDIAEMLAILSDMSYESPDALQCITLNGIRRAKLKKKNAAQSGT